MPPDRPSSWRSSNSPPLGPYQRHIRRLAQYRPDVNFVDLFMVETPDLGIGRIVALQLDRSSNVLSRTYITTRQELRDRLNEDPPGEVTTLFLVEDLTPLSVEILGSFLDVDPAFFTHHIRATRMEIHADMGRPPKLPTDTYHRDTLNVEYVQVVWLENPDVLDPSVIAEEYAEFGKELFVDTNLWRKLDTTRTMGTIGEVAFLRGKLSVSRRRRPSGGWAAVVLVDPPLSRVVVRRDARSRAQQGAHIPFKFGMYQGGYLDFRQCPNMHSAETALPERVSVLDDTVFYLEYHEGVIEKNANFFNDGSSAASLAYIPFKIIASQWVNVMEFLSADVGRLELILSDSDFLQNHLVAFYTWKRRFRIFLGQLQRTKAVLEANKAEEAPWVEQTLYLDHLIADFSYLISEMHALNMRAESILTTAIASVQVTDTRLQGILANRSLVESRNMTKLTYLALFFAPISLVCGIFGIEGEFGPGANRFWVPFVVSAPIVAIVFLLAHTLFDPSTSKGVITARQKP